MFKCCLVDLSIVLNDVYGFALSVDKRGDQFSALVPAHLGALVLKGFNEDNSLRLGHSKPIGKCLVIKGLDPFFVDC